MSITYHGSYNSYVPVPSIERPATLMSGISFSKNEFDQDFYDVKRSINAKALVVLTPAGDSRIVGASKGVLMAFPTAGQRMYSIFPAPEGLTPEQALMKTLDPDTGEIT